MKYWSVNVWRERKASVNKNAGLYLLKQGRSYRLIHVMDLFKGV